MRASTMPAVLLYLYLFIPFVNSHIICLCVQESTLPCPSPTCPVATWLLHFLHQPDGGGLCTYVYECIHAHTGSHTCTLTHTNTHTHGPTHAQAHTYTHAHTRARTRTHTRARTHTHTHARTHIGSHMCTLTCTWTHTCAHTRTHTCIFSFFSHSAHIQHNHQRKPANQQWFSTAILYRYEGMA